MNWQTNDILLTTQELGKSTRNKNFPILPGFTESERGEREERERKKKKKKN